MNIQTTVSTTCRIDITRAELIEALNLPKDAEIFISIPGGGDWSNTDLSIDAETPLKAEFTMVTWQGPNQ